MVVKTRPVLGSGVCVWTFSKEVKLVLCRGVVCLSVPLGRMKDMS